MTNLPKVNYNAVASTYDQRVQGGSYLAGVTMALQALAEQVKARRLLDLGCGTGRSLQRIGVNLIRCGLDFSGGMLAQASRLNADYCLTQASAPKPPFSHNTFDLIFCVHAFHHFPNKPQVIHSAFDLLRPGGTFAIINFDPRESDLVWPVYEYFEGVYETDLTRFPGISEQERMLRQAGFQQVSSPIVQLIESEIIGEAIFEDYYMGKEACSQFILLSDEAYEAGLNRMRERINRAKAKNETVVFRTYLKNRMCHGFKI